MAGGSQSPGLFDDPVGGSPARAVPKQAVPDAQKTRRKPFSVASKPRQPSNAPPRNSAFIEAMMETDSNTMVICSMPAWLFLYWARSKTECTTIRRESACEEW